MELNGKILIYVGGYGGIGYESCKAFIKQGIAQLLIFDVIDDADKLQQLQALNVHCTVHFLQLDLMDKPSIERAFAKALQQLGGLDILVNGSGIMNEHEIERTMGINLLGPIYSTFAALRYMDKSQGGQGGVIVNISSMVGLDAYGGYAVYTATKYGINGFSRALADPFYYAKSGVAFITICPATTETPMLAALRIDSVTTFPERPPLPRTLCNNQTAAECARNLVQAVRTAKNGSFWILSGGQLHEYVYPEINC